MANRFFSQFMFGLRKMPIQLDCSFVVDKAIGTGLGVKQFNGPGIKKVLMNTTATSGTDPDAWQMEGLQSPAAGTIVVEFEDAYSSALLADFAVSGIAGTPVKIDNGATLTLGVAYVITTLGDATENQWRTIGVPLGVTPAVGVSFIAIATGAGAGDTSTSRVAPSATAAEVASIEVFGNPNLALTTVQPVYSSVDAPSSKIVTGLKMILQCRDFAGAIVTPSDGTKISLRFLLSNSSVSYG